MFTLHQKQKHPPYTPPPPPPEANLYWHWASTCPPGELSFLTSPTLREQCGRHSFDGSSCPVLSRWECVPCLQLKWQNLPQLRPWRQKQKPKRAGLHLLTQRGASLEHPSCCLHWRHLEMRLLSCVPEAEAVRVTPPGRGVCSESKPLPVKTWLSIPRLAASSVSTVTAHTVIISRYRN